MRARHPYRIDVIRIARWLISGIIGRLLRLIKGGGVHHEVTKSTKRFQ